MRHLMESGVDHLVIHAEHEDIVEIILEQSLQLWTGLAVDVPFLRLRRGIDLALQGGDADDRAAVLFQIAEAVLQKDAFVLRLDMLQHIQRIDRIERARHRAVQHVVDQGIEAPALHHPVVDVLDEDGIEIDRRQILDFRLDDANTEGIAAADLEHVAAALEHLGHELIAR